MAESLSLNCVLKAMDLHVPDCVVDVETKHKRRFLELKRKKTVGQRCGLSKSFSFAMAFSLL